MPENKDLLGEVTKAIQNPFKVNKGFYKSDQLPAVLFSELLKLTATLARDQGDLKS